MEYAREVTRPLAAVFTFVVLLAAPAWADHPGPFRSEGMSPLMTALITAGLAFLVALVVVVIVVLLTRKPPDAQRGDTE